MYNNFQIFISTNNNDLSQSEFGRIPYLVEFHI